MICNTKEILEKINEENYSPILRVTTKEELKEDLIKYLDLDIEDDNDLEKLNQYLNKFNGKNDYVICGGNFGCGQLMTYQNALENEKDYALSNLNGENDSTSEILEAFFNEVENKLLVTIDKDEFDEKLEEYSEIDGENAYKDTLLSFVDKTIFDELKESGWNTNYLEDTLNCCNVCASTGEVIEIYGYVVM